MQYIAFWNLFLGGNSHSRKVEGHWVISRMRVRSTNCILWITANMYVIPPKINIDLNVLFDLWGVKVGVKCNMSNITFWNLFLGVTVISRKVEGHWVISRMRVRSTNCILWITAIMYVIPPKINTDLNVLFDLWGVKVGLKCNITFTTSIFWKKLHIPLPKKAFFSLFRNFWYISNAGCKTFANFF